jgi:hypothetical protein
MHQKDILFSEPLVHGMCTSLQNTHKAEFPQDMDNQEEVAQGRDAQEAGVLDLNMPQDMDA